MNSPQLDIKLLLCFKSYYKIARIVFSKTDSDEERSPTLEAKVQRYSKPIKMTELPDEEIISFIEMSWINERGFRDTCFLMHFSTQLKLYFLNRGKITKSFQKSYKRRNIISFTDRTFFWEDKGRIIERMESTIPRDEKNYFYHAYNAKNEIKM